MNNSALQQMAHLEWLVFEYSSPWINNQSELMNDVLIKMCAQVEKIHRCFFGTHTNEVHWVSQDSGKTVFYHVEAYKHV